MGEALTTHFSGIGYFLSDFVWSNLKRRNVKAIKRIQELLSTQAGKFRSLELRHLRHLIPFFVNGKPHFSNKVI